MCLINCVPKLEFLKKPFENIVGKGEKKNPVSSIYSKPLVIVPSV